MGLVRDKGVHDIKGQEVIGEAGDVKTGFYAIELVVSKSAANGEEAKYVVSS